jgi:hypothetical protein
MEKFYGKQDKLTFTVYFEEFKGVVHLEALEMLSRQSSVKLELQLINKLWMKNPLTKDNMNIIENAFDSEKLNDDYDLEEDDGLSSCAEDLKLLANNRDKTFDVNKFESLINNYASRFYLRNVTDKVVSAYKSAVTASKEDLSPLEIVNSTLSIQVKFKVK